LTLLLECEFTLLIVVFILSTTTVLATLLVEGVSNVHTSCWSLGVDENDENESGVIFCGCDLLFPYSSAY
jgi:hypothetical protein